MDRNDKLEVVGGVLCTLLGVVDVIIGVACVKQGVETIAEVKTRKELLG